ncbi:redoxin domain-containing protein [Haladaptatus sp. DJG-WS-42]|uniref:redoxin domain-containing protein n=1 Tax=Haladaptatus sp. DJG-WS-42 TaxID=3120516 RepID=UPI0030D3F708
MVDFDVVELPETDHVDVGDDAPDFTRPLVNEEFWEDVALSELLEDGPVLLVFHTMDGAFPSTYIWNQIRDRQWGDHLQVVGLSISSPYEHKTFIAEREMDYQLFSDPANEVAEAYGIVNDLDGMSGIEEPRPAIFRIDEDGTVDFAWVASEWPDFPEYDAVEEVISN